MKLLLDQGLPVSAAAELRKQGLDVEHVAEIGMMRATDNDILAHARRIDAVCITLSMPIFMPSLSLRERENLRLSVFGEKV